MKHGSFTQIVKEEIANYEYDYDQYLSLLSGFIKTNGSVSISSKKLVLSLQTENSKIAKLIYRAIITCFKVTPQFSYSKKMRLDKCVVYHLFVHDKVEEILNRLEIMQGFERVNPKSMIEDERLRFFIAGVFLASGSVNAPSSSNYHLQMIVTDENDAKFLIRILNRFKNDKSMGFKYIARRNKFLVYLKRADQIAIFLALINAPIAMMNFENSRIEKDYINSENRYQICFNANFQKTIKKANEQIQDIQTLIEKSEFIHLSEDEQKVANVRMNNQEIALSGIVNILKEEGITMSKARISRIFNKIHDKAISLRSK